MENKAVLSTHIIRGSRDGSLHQKIMLKSIPRDEGDFCLYTAYLSGENCSLIAEKGRTNARIRRKALKHGEA